MTERDSTDIKVYIHIHQAERVKSRRKEGRVKTEGRKSQDGRKEESRRKEGRVKRQDRKEKSRKI